MNKVSIDSSCVIFSSTSGCSSNSDVWLQCSNGRNNLKVLIIALNLLLQELQKSMAIYAYLPSGWVYCVADASYDRRHMFHHHINTTKRSTYNHYMLLPLSSLWLYLVILIHIHFHHKWITVAHHVHSRRVVCSLQITAECIFKTFSCLIPSVQSF